MTDRSSRDLQAQVLDTISEMVIYYDRGLRIEWANRAAAESVGQSVEHMIGRHCHEIWHSRATPCDGCPVIQARETGQPHSAEMITPDGRVWHVRGYPILDETGQVEALIEFCQDITDRKATEQALQDSQARLELAVQGADLGMYDWNVRTGEIVINDRYAAMLGYTVEELDLTMEKWAATIHPDDRSREVEMVAQQLAGDDSLIETVYRVQTKAGDWRWVLDRGKVVERDGDGRPIRVAGTRLDITARKQAEEERAKLQTQLLQAQKMEAVGRLTAGIAHDFNNLLTVILGFSELIKLQLAPEDRLNDPLDKVINAGNTAANLIQQLMAFSRQQVMQPQVVDLNQVIGRMEPMVRRIIGEDVALEVRLGDNLWPVLVDPTQIQQVLVNLIVNAREAMPHGGRIGVETRNVTLDAHQAAALADARVGDHIAICIRDTGCGMSAEVQARIFDPFFTTKPQGTGLGLPTVYGIVTQSGGCIQVESTVGQGSAFTVFLPRTNRVADVPATPSKPAARRGSETILLVEDSLEVRQYAREVLQDHGYTVLEAGCGQDALRLAADVPTPLTSS
jgi:two-component system cell cycle sensor histidine kinase/response regulator CckA